MRAPLDYGHPLKRVWSDQKAFTLMELLITILIIGILATIAMPYFTGALNAAKNSKAQQALKNGLRNVKAFYIDQDTFDSSAAIVSWLQENERNYTYKVYGAGSSESTGPQDVSIQVDDQDMITMCTRSDTTLIFCLRYDQRGELLIASAPEAGGSLLANAVSSSSLLAPGTANAQSASPDFADSKWEAKAMGYSEPVVRAALSGRNNLGNNSVLAFRGWRNNLAGPACAGQGSTATSGIGCNTGTGGAGGGGAGGGGGGGGGGQP